MLPMSLPLTDDRIAVSESVAASLGRTNMLKHSQDVRNLKRKPAPISRLDAPVTIQIDSDIVPSLLDQFGASGEESWEKWLGAFLSDAARGNLGL
jgi:hypothetical protein